MKNFERKDKNERRRVLLSKNYELSHSFDNEKLPQENDDIQANEGNFARPDGTVLRTVINKHFRTIIAVIVALCIAVPSMMFATLQGRATNEQTSRVTVDGLETTKTVTPVEGEDGKYHVKLEAYNTSEFLNQPANDIILILDNSARMDTELYRRYYKNLNTHTMFVPIENASYNDLHTVDNPKGDSALIQIGNQYSTNKYVKDPNTPGAYTYLVSTYHADDLVGYYHHWDYSFTDSLGNVYTYTTPSVGSISSLIFGDGNTQHFVLDTSKPPVGDPVPYVDIDAYYKLVDAETDGLNKTI